MKPIIYIFILKLIANVINCQDLTPSDVCTDVRTKSSFCNNENNCNATGVILCYGTNLGVNILCGNSQKYCTPNENGDYCGSLNPCSSSVINRAPFECTGPGYYPNPYDCTSYYFCSLNSDKTLYTSNMYNCTSGNVFYPSTGSYCTRQNAIINNCQTVYCGNTTEPKYIQIQYGTNRQYYALCLPDANPMNPSVLVFVCPANSIPNLSKTPATCSYNCWRVGFFQNTLDNSKYFECYLNNYFRFESIERRCPTGSSFDATRSECVVKIRSLSGIVENRKKSLF